MRKNKKNFGQKFTTGQTLMEVLIGVGVMGVILTGVTGLIAASLQGARVTREKTLAQSLIHDMAAVVKGIVQSDWHDLWASASGIGYWSLDDGAGAAETNATALDQIMGNNATLSLGISGNTALTSAWLSGANCKAGQCVSLDGTDDVLSIADASDGSLDFGTTSFSLGMWIYATASTGTMDMPWWKGGEISSATGYTFMLGTGAWQVGLSDGVTQKALSLGSETLGQWVHLMAVVNRGTGYAYAYRDGVEIASTSVAGFGSVSNSSGVRLGSDISGNYDFNGRIDEVRLYHRALSSAEVAGIASGVNAFYPARVGGIWQLKEGKETQESGGAMFTRFFAIEPVMRDGNNNIVSSGGTDDPLTKRIVYTAQWGSRTLSEYEYVSRIADAVFTQTDWSSGLVGTTTVFTGPTAFMAASSGIAYSTAGVLSNQLGTSASSSIDTTYRYAWSDTAGWFDFYPAAYASETGTFSGIASSTMGGVSLSCADLGICDTSNYKVYRKLVAGSGYAEGELYGYGWSDVSGWLSFNCNQTGVGGSDSCATVDYGVSIASSTGNFSGYAWSDVIGWLSFNCADLSVCGTSDYKVKLNTSPGNSGADFLESMIFDTRVEGGVVPVAITWQGTLPADTQVRFQIASSNSEAGPWEFVGNDGTTSTYYPGTGSAQPNASVFINKKHHFNHLYFRYKIFLNSSATEAPQVEDVSLLWKQ